MLLTPIPATLLEKAEGLMFNRDNETLTAPADIPESGALRHRTREEAKADVFEYIETYYNPIRRHSTLNYLSPRDFENRMAA